MARNLILIGGGGHTKACLEVISSNLEWNVKGYIDINSTFRDTIGLTYLGNDLGTYKYINDAEFLITVGQIETPFVRIKLFNDLKKINGKFATVLSSNAIVSSKSIINEGTIVMHGVIIQSNVSIGENCIINDRALIEHDSKVGNHCHISTGAIVNGGVEIGNGVFIGSGAIIRNGISIGDNCFIGMGAIVTKSVTSGTKLFGKSAN